MRAEFPYKKNYFSKVRMIFLDSRSSVMVYAMTFTVSFDKPLWKEVQRNSKKKKKKKKKKKVR